MSRGGRRPGAGRPPTGDTARSPVTWRLPIHLLTRISIHAEFEGMPVTRWVERALEHALETVSAGESGRRQAGEGPGAS